MAAVRRSTRKSVINNVEKSDVLTTPTIRRRRTEIWRRRQTHSLVDSDDNSDGDCLNTEEGNIENLNIMNKTSVRRARKEKEDQKVEPTTPRSVRCKKGAAVSRSASKKRESPNKRKVVESVIDNDDANGSDDGYEEPQNASPPKQARQKQHLQKHLISPSRLIDRLSIEERNECTDNEDNGGKPEKQSPRNKYQNARRVLNSAETQNLPGREQQLTELREFFTEHLEAKSSGSLYVSGQPGTGKTACLSLLLRSSEFSHRLRCIYINCTSIASVGGVYKKICAELNLHPKGRTERDHLAAIQDYICTTAKMILIVLDEIDQLCTSRQSVLYTIFEWPALPRAKLLLVGIANSLDLTDRALQRLNARCELKPQLLHFPPYSKQQIIEIFRSRLEEAGVLDVFPPVTLQLLAAKVSAVSGDVRRALDIGRRVVEIAEQQMSAGKRQVNLDELDVGLTKGNHEQEEPLKPVQVSQVAAVLNKVYGASQNLQEDIEESFPLQQKLMLCSLMLMLRKERNKDITMGRLHEVYRRVCTKRNIHSVDQAEFAGLVDLVETRGILRIMRKKEPRLNKILLQWDEEEVNAALCDKQLIASILDDVACLNK